MRVVGVPSLDANGVSGPPAWISGYSALHDTWCFLSIEQRHSEVHEVVG